MHSMHSMQSSTSQQWYVATESVLIQVPSLYSATSANSGHRQLTSSRLFQCRLSSSFKPMCRKQNKKSQLSCIPYTMKGEERRKGKEMRGPSSAFLPFFWSLSTISFLSNHPKKSCYQNIQKYLVMSAGLDYPDYYSLNKYLPTNMVKSVCLPDFYRQICLDLSRHISVSI